MKTGDIILVSGQSKQAEAIKAFQEKQDKESAKWHHSGLLYVTKHNVWVVEASYIQQRKVKAAVVFTNLEHYLSGNYNLLHLQHNGNVDEKILEENMFHYVGTPYGYWHLILVQGVWKTLKIWLGRKKNADKRMICHEYTKTVWNRTNGYFEGVEHIGDVKDIFHNPNFNKIRIK